MNITFPSSYNVVYVNLADVVWAVTQPLAFVICVSVFIYFAYRFVKHVRDNP